MAVIHRTTLRPTKLELLTAWLPSRPWYVGEGGAELVKTGGFRLDDPAGEVGIEFMVVTDVSGGGAVDYLVPLTYRGAPLEGAEGALVGTTEHGTLGRRWAYDGCYDPVLVGELAALLEGRTQAQDQNTSDAVDEEVARVYDGPALTGAVVVAEDEAGTELRAEDGTVLRLHRALAAGAVEAGAGHLAGAWQRQDGTRARGPFVTLA
ncbi:1,4-alpha-glucan branching protein [Kitasatospora sp. NPDC101183]|uniref:maltokinase N-terminal cap-like domain-containing protein n=1 Tax=Kitasatospora sp. NPDC101183 TaxID=3364100 RepID=UPI0038116CC2